MTEEQPAAVQVRCEEQPHKYGMGRHPDGSLYRLPLQMPVRLDAGGWQTRDRCPLCGTVRITTYDRDFGNAQRRYEYPPGYLREPAR